jgi:hypothetical protein
MATKLSNVRGKPDSRAWAEWVQAREAYQAPRARMAVRAPALKVGAAGDGELQESSSEGTVAASSPAREAKSVRFADFLDTDFVCIPKKEDVSWLETVAAWRPDTEQLKLLQCTNVCRPGGTNYR